MNSPKIKRFGPKAILICWLSEIRSDFPMFITSISNIITEQLKEDVIECVPAYASLCVYFNKEIDYKITANSICRIIKNINKNDYSKSKEWKIPVCYDQVFGLDLKKISKDKNLSVEEIIKIHTTVLYQVYAIGFLPGFPYLATVDEQIRMDRHKSPRIKVLKGSVAIAGEQTGIYTSNSPGGWHIIGHCPLDIFDINRKPFSLFSTGDQVRFYSIEKKEYLEIVNSNSFEQESYLL